LHFIDFKIISICWCPGPIVPIDATTRKHYSTFYSLY